MAATEVGAEPAPSPAEEGGGAGASPLLSIGQLVRELRRDFPDLTISKVRYLEDRGLIAPQRTESRYRKYSKADARRLRSVLLMQRDQYLPLDVIRRRVDDTQAVSGAADGLLHTVASPLSFVVDEPTHTLQDLCLALDVDQEFILSLVEFRLLESKSDDGPAFTEDDLEAARICLRLARFNVEARHLRAVSSAMERQAGLIEQVVGPALQSGHPDRREYGLESLQHLGALFAQLNRLLLRRELGHLT